MTDATNPQPGHLGRKVFVIHGRDRKVRKGFSIFLRSIGLDPMEWNETLAATDGGAPFIGDVLDSVLKMPHAFVVLLTPDDEVRLKREHANDDNDPDLRLSGQARPNVLFEAGMALALAPERTVLVEVGEVRAFSDVAGRYVVRLNNSAERRNTLAQRLAKIGCDVDLSGNAWYTDGDLNPPASTSENVSPPERDTPDPDAPKITVSVGDYPLVLDNFNVIPRTRGGVSLHGEAVNNGPTLTFMLKATFYAPGQRIVGTGSAFVNSVSKGDMKTFELTTRDDVEGYDAIHVQVETAIAG